MSHDLLALPIGSRGAKFPVKVAKPLRALLNLTWGRFDLPCLKMVVAWHRRISAKDYSLPQHRVGGDQPVRDGEVDAQ
jgi:hypothetical protein